MECRLDTGDDCLSLTPGRRPSRDAWVTGKEVGRLTGRLNAGDVELRGLRGWALWHCEAVDDAGRFPPWAGVQRP